MRSARRLLDIVPVVVLLLALFVATTGHASSITLWPAVIPLEGSRGQSTTQVLTLKNDTDLPLEFVMEAQDVVVRDGARVFVEAGELADSIAATAVMTPRQLQVDAHSNATVTVTLTLPAEMRHRAAVVFFRGTSLVPAGNRQARLSLGSLFTFTGSDRVSVALRALTAEPPTATDNARLESTLVNDGDEPVVPSGMAVILDAAGRLAGKAAFPARRLLPGETLTLAADYPGELPPGAYRVVATFDVAGRATTLTESLDVR